MKEADALFAFVAKGGGAIPPPELDAFANAHSPTLFAVAADYSVAAAESAHLATCRFQCVGHRKLWVVKTGQLADYLRVKNGEDAYKLKAVNEFMSSLTSESLKDFVTFKHGEKRC